MTEDEWTSRVEEQNDEGEDSSGGLCVLAYTPRGKIVFSILDYSLTFWPVGFAVAVNEQDDEASHSIVSFQTDGIFK